MQIRENDQPEHIAADLEELLAEDPRVSEQGLRVSVAATGDGAVTITGAVATPSRRDAVAAVVAEHLPGRPIVNRVEVLEVRPPTEEHL